MNAVHRRPLLILAVLLAAGTLPLLQPPESAAQGCSPGPFGLSLGTSGAHVALGDPAALHLTAFTLEAWIRRDGPGAAVSTGTDGLTAVPLVTKGRAEADGDDRDMNFFLGLREADDVLVADFEDLNGGLNHPITSATAIAPGAWTHVAVTYDPDAAADTGTWRLMVNGAEVATLDIVDADAGARTPRAGSIQPAALGTTFNSPLAAPPAAPLGAFDGVMDEVRIWNHARTATEIAGAMNTEVPTAPGLVARWSLNEGCDTTVGDSSGSGLTGTIGGTGHAWVAGAPALASNQAPAAPALVGPADGAVGVATPPTLAVQVDDPDLDPLTVTFHGRALDPGATDFTIVTIPDTQFYSESDPGTFNAQTQWILGTAPALNTVFVTHLGDICQNRDQVETEWQQASGALGLLDGQVPYGLAPGNHDMSPAGVAALFDEYFPVGRFAPYPWYGGGYRANKNNYAVFSAGGLDFLVLHLEYDMPGDAVAWAAGVLDAHPNHRAILSTHLFLDGSGDRPVAPLERPDGTSAESVWQSLIAGRCNVFMVLNGHYPSPGEARLTSTNACGRPVHQILQDYQARPNGGDGWLRYYTFRPSHDTIQAYTYSPTLGRFETDAGSQFSLDYEMAAAAFSPIGSNAGVVPGTTTSIEWTGLAPGTTYEWYAEVDDGQATITGPVWSLTTAAICTPTGPSDPTCDGLDDDCDGLTDEDYLPGACLTGEPGACSDGTSACAGGVESCDRNTEPSAELCDGIDNDCDGVTDNGFALGQACTAGTGACQAAGVTVCDGAQTGTTCNAVPGTPTAELCDGIDNDCDGATDEDLGLTLCGTGVCQSSVPACVNGTPQTCTPNPPQTTAAVAFDGVNDYIVFGNHPSITQAGASSFTVEGWFKAAAATQFAGIFRHGRQGTASQVAIQLAGSTPYQRITASVEDTAGHQVDAPPVDINLGQWYHVALVVDRGANQMRLYLDGALVSSADGATWGANPISSTDAVVMGAARLSGGTLGSYFAGRLDEFRIWNVARTQGQIQAHRRQAITSAPGLVARWGFDEGSGFRANDSVGPPQINFGALMNGVAWVADTAYSLEASCDGLDNDCDGLVDEDFVLTPTTCGVGGCTAAGTTVCSAGVLGNSCTPGTPAANDAVCNGIDDDCDGGTDEDYVPTATACGVGTCGATGELTCSNGTVVDTCSPGAPAGNYGIDFDGPGSYVTFGVAPALGASQFTLEAWFKREGPGVPIETGVGGIDDALPLLTKGRGEADGGTLDMNWFLGIRASDGVLVADFEDRSGGGNHPVAGTTPIADNTWYHAAAVYDGAAWRLYLNGALEATAIANAVPRFDSIQHAAIATAMDSFGGPAGWFDGVIDEARVWNVPRSDVQIAAGMAGPITTAPGLAGRWGFDEGTGPLVPSTSSPVTGTLAGGVYVHGTPFAFGSDPRNDAALQLDGAGAHVVFGPAPGLGASVFTVEIWFNRRGLGAPTGTGSGGVIALPLLTRGRGEADGDNRDMNWFLGLRHPDGVLVADFEDTATGGNHPVAGATPVPFGSWHHAAATYDGSTWRLYLDGILEAESAVGAQPRFDSIQHAAVGSALNSTGVADGFFDGLVDEPRVWNVARSQADIRSGMRRLIPAAPGLIGRWAFDEGGGATATGTAGTTPINGTIVGGVSVDGFPFRSILAAIDTTCNGADDDCDGQVDEDLPPITCGYGICARTVDACVGGAPQACTPGTPEVETCNGVDDNCDGVIDDGFAPGEATGLGFTDAVSLAWTTPAGAVANTLHRGTIAGGGGYVHNHACLRPGLAAPAASDTDLPPIGTAFYYLAAATNACGEGPLGRISGGAPRPNLAPCP